VLSGVAAGAHAERGIVEEVVVTAEKREESLQNTPIAMAALTGEELSNRGITGFGGIAASSPSVAFAPFPTSSDTLILFMRGQGNGDPGQITKDGAIGLYEDGIYIARAQGSTFDLADVERVEVLRGPQGTLYGRNTTGGAVNIITKKPTGEFGLKQTLSFGSRDLFRSLTAINLPQWGPLAAKVTLLKSGQDGNVKNPGSSHDFGEQAQRAGRLALHWNAADAVEFDYALEKGSIDSTPLYFQNAALAGTIPGYTLDKERAYRSVDLRPSRVNYEGHALTAEWDMGDALTIKSLTGYRKLDADYYQDFAEAFGYAYNNSDLIRGHQFSQEFQFIGSLLDNRLNYSSGLFYFKDSDSHFARANIGNGATVTDRYVVSDAKSLAAYAQFTWTPAILDDRLDLTLGGRYTRDDRDAARDKSSNAVVQETGVSNSQSFKRFNPAFTVNYRATDDLNAYAKVATGYRAGGSNERNVDFTSPFGPEKVTTFEIGVKSYWWDHRLRANAAAFKTDYRDMQIDISPNGNPSITQTLNAGRAKIDGVEFDLLLVPMADLTLNASYAYLHPKLEKVDVNGADQTGLYVIPFAPRSSYDLGLDYTLLRFARGDLAAHVDYRWQDDTFTSGGAGAQVRNRDFYQRPAYGTLDGRLTLTLALPRGDSAKIAIWGKNLSDRVYKSFVTGNGSPYTGYNSQAYALGEPRSVGVDLVYEY